MFKLLVPISLLPLVFIEANPPVPQFDMSSSCRNGVAASQVAGRSVDACMSQELEAMNKIKDQWATFTGEERARCFRMVNKGGAPSYVEALTCMQVGREVRKINESSAQGQ